jgi:hypothetical protein
LGIAVVKPQNVAPFTVTSGEPKYYLGKKNDLPGLEKILKKL